MKAISHAITHQYQPTPTTCSPTTLSMILEHYGKHLTPEELGQTIPQAKDSSGNDAGTVTQQMATWCVSQGFEVSLYTFDCQVIDQSWANLERPQLLQRLQAALDGTSVPTLGEEWSRVYRQAYIDYLQSGATLAIRPYVSSALLYELLERGPVFGNACLNTLHGRGKTNVDDGLDDVNGRAWNHSFVIYGNDEDGNFLIADPLIKPGMHTVAPEQLVAGIMAAQIECDDFIFQIVPRH